MESSKYKRAYNTTIYLIGDNHKNLRYLQEVVLPGIYNSLAQHYGLGRSDEVVQGMKAAIYDTVSDMFFGGCEPTFETSESYEWWNNMGDHYFNDDSIRYKQEYSFKDEYEFKGFIFEEN